MNVKQLPQQFKDNQIHPYEGTEAYHLLHRNGSKDTQLEKGEEPLSYSTIETEKDDQKRAAMRHTLVRPNPRRSPVLPLGVRRRAPCLEKDYRREMQRSQFARGKVIGRRAVLELGFMSLRKRGCLLRQH